MFFLTHGATNTNSISQIQIHQNVTCLLTFLMTCGATFSMLFDIIIITSLQTQLFHDIQYLEEDLAGGAGQYFNLICSKQKRFDMENSSEILYGILIRGRGFSPFGMNDSCGSSRIFFWQDSSKFEITGVVYNQKHIQLLLNIKVPVLMLFVLFKFQSKAISVLRLLRNILNIQPTYWKRIEMCMKLCFGDGLKMDKQKFRDL